MKDTITRSEFDKAVDQVLSRPEYAHLKRGLQDLLESLKEAIGQWLRELLEKAFSNLSSAPSLNKSAATVFLVIGLVGFLAIVVFIVVKASKTFSRKPTVREILGEKITAGTTTTSLREKAAGYMENGEYRLAFRYEYIALLLLMHEKNLFFLDEAKTNDEITSYLEKSDFKPLSVFKNLVELFNASWYGHKTPQEAICEQWSSSMNLVWDRVNGIEK